MKFETEAREAFKNVAPEEDSKSLFDLIQVLDGRDSPSLKILENNRNMNDRNFYVH